LATVLVIVGLVVGPVACSDGEAAAPTTTTSSTTEPAAVPIVVDATARSTTTTTTTVPAAARIVDPQVMLRTMLNGHLAKLAVDDPEVIEQCLGPDGPALDLMVMDATALAATVKFLYPCAANEMAVAGSTRSDGSPVEFVAGFELDQQLCARAAEHRAFGSLEVEEIIEVASGRGGSWEVLVEPVMAWVLASDCDFEVEEIEVVLQAARPA
jgi:hypothetical protein